MNSASPAPSRLARLPIFYGWIIVAAAFVTMAVGVNARTAFSLLFPPILDEFGWAFGLIAGAFSAGTLVSTLAAPFLGRAMDRSGPRWVILGGVLKILSIGLRAGFAPTTFGS